MGSFALWRASREFTFQFAKDNLPPGIGPGFLSIPASRRSMLLIVAAIRQILGILQARAGILDILVLSLRV